MSEETSVKPNKVPWREGLKFGGTFGGVALTAITIVLVSVGVRADEIELIVLTFGGVIWCGVCGFFAGYHGALEVTTRKRVDEFLRWWILRGLIGAGSASAASVGILIAGGAIAMILDIGPRPTQRFRLSTETEEALSIGLYACLASVWCASVLGTLVAPARLRELELMIMSVWGSIFGVIVGAWAASLVVSTVFVAIEWLEWRFALWQFQLFGALAGAIAGTACAVIRRLRMRS